MINGEYVERQNAGRVQCAQFANLVQGDIELPSIDENLRQHFLGLEIKRIKMDGSLRLNNRLLVAAHLSQEVGELCVRLHQAGVQVDRRRLSTRTPSHNGSRNRRNCRNKHLSAGTPYS